MAGKKEKPRSPESFTRSGDIEDSKYDRDRLRQDKATIDLPDTRDIPGQEHIHVPPLGELSDTTISSDDEEGRGVFVDDEEDETFIKMGSEADISKGEQEILETTDNLNVSEKDDAMLARGFPDNKDAEGEQLNEQINVSGSDLDVAGSEEDDANEKIGEEDEENNPYSLGGDKDT